MHCATTGDLGIDDNDDASLSAYPNPQGATLVNSRTIYEQIQDNKQTWKMYWPGANWSEAHQRYLRELVLPLPALKAVLEEYLLAIDQAVHRVERLDELLAVQVLQWRMYPAVEALMCLRGFQLTAAAVLVAELGDVRRFAHPRHVMAYLGLVPKENTTGDTRRLGGITKAGNAHARWILIEVIQHAYLPPKVLSSVWQTDNNANWGTAANWNGKSRSCLRVLPADCTGRSRSRQAARTASWPLTRRCSSGSRTPPRW